VQSGPRRGEAELLPDPVDQQQRSDLFDLLLHREEADQFAVQAGEHVIDARGRTLLRQRDRGFWVQHLATPLRPGPPRS
jgi:hypothetical protein